MIDRRTFLATLAASLATPTLAWPRASHSASWDGRWAGAWGGRDATAINVSGGRVVSYEYGGQTNPVDSSRVTPSRVVYHVSDIVVTMTRTGANSAHATIKTSQGKGTAELVRR